MRKFTVTNTTIDIVTQQGDEVNQEKSLMGIISKTKSGYKFEESIRKGRNPRSEKVYDGRYCSLFKRRNGKYQIYLKLMQLDGHGLDAQEMAYHIYSDVHAALDIITL